MVKQRRNEQLSHVARGENVFTTDTHIHKCKDGGGVSRHRFLPQVKCRKNVDEGGGREDCASCWQSVGQ